MQTQSNRNRKINALRKQQNSQHKNKIKEHKIIQQIQITSVKPSTLTSQTPSNLSSTGDNFSSSQTKSKQTNPKFPIKLRKRHTLPPNYFHETLSPMQNAPLRPSLGHHSGNEVLVFDLAIGPDIHLPDPLVELGRLQFLADAGEDVPELRHGHETG
ncbi:hypothetical protein C1H46_029803 [Malus baccata]|uniref:Uncharacterized protein n=1 Tax=Malus baccata TaxID=106549 RepID=A0A540LDS7_MALBA|nr:hypothetical protein C1H46_029803 [Malus baccata]